MATNGRIRQSPMGQIARSRAAHPWLRSGGTHLEPAMLQRAQVHARPGYLQLPAALPGRGKEYSFLQPPKALVLPMRQVRLCRPGIRSLSPARSCSRDRALGSFQLPGLEAHKPFECVGEAGETRLAFEICRSRGFRGRAIDLYAKQAAYDVAELAQFYSEIAPPSKSFPSELWRRLSPFMLAASRDSFQDISSTF